MPGKAQDGIAQSDFFSQPVAEQHGTPAATDVPLIIVRFRSHKRKRPPRWRGACSSCNSLTMTYFHTGTRTIIGAESFHCPVRDGKEWYQLAMVIRHNLVLC